MSLAYFPLYPDDFEADTAHLTLAEDGAYNRLLRLCWRTPGCSIPADRSWIYRRMRALSDDDKAVIDVVLDEFFTVRDGRASNARLAKEWLAANAAHERRKNAGAKGGKAKAAETNKKISSNAVAKPKQPEPEPEPKRDTIVSLSFDDFWAVVPRKVAKGQARKAWAQAVKRAPPETIIAGMRRYAAERDGQDERFTAHPATWLNAERWTDETPRKDKPDGLTPGQRAAARFAAMDSGQDRNAIVPLFSAGDRREDSGGCDDGLDTSSFFNAPASNIVRM